MKRRDIVKAGLTAGLFLPAASVSGFANQEESGLLEDHAEAAKIIRKGPLINLEQAYRVMHEENLDGLIVSDPTNIFYLTGYFDHLGIRFDSITMFVLLSRDETKPISVVMNQFIYYFCVTDSNFSWEPDMYLYTGWNKAFHKGPKSISQLEPQASEPVTWRNVGEVPIGKLEMNRLTKLEETLNAIPESADMKWAFSKAVKAAGFQKATIGVDNPKITHMLDSLNFETQTVDGEYALRRVKMVKSNREIQLMTYAAQKNAEAALAAVRQVRAGASYYDLRALYFTECSKRGGSPKLLQINTVNSEIFNANFKEGDAFAIDGVSQYFHYTGDYGRTIFLGEPSRSMKRATTAIAVGWDAVRETLRPGMRYSEIRAIGRDAIKKAGFDFGVAVTPHSVGLSHTDEPGRDGPGALWQKADLVLQENMVISVDLPVLNTGIGGSAHLEDLTLITKDGGKQINNIGDRIVIV